MALDLIAVWMQDKPTTRGYFDLLRTRLAEDDSGALISEALGAAYELARVINAELPSNMSFAAVESAARIYTGLEA